MDSSCLKCWLSACLRCSPSVTSRALIRLSGAASESTNDAISVRAVSDKSAISASGDIGPSVIATTCAPQRFANRIASSVRVE